MVTFDVAVQRTREQQTRSTCLSCDIGEWSEAGRIRGEVFARTRRIVIGRAKYALNCFIRE